MNFTRIARNLSTVAVAAIAAWSSWSHMVDVALRFGERPVVAYVLPVSVDGMLVVASTAMVDDQRAGRPVRWSVRIAFLTGVTASVAANITAAQPTLGARIVAAWPAVALLLVVEMLSRDRRHGEPSPSRRPGSSPVDSQKGDGSGPSSASTTSAPETKRAGRHPGRAGHRRPRGERTLESVLSVRYEQPDASAADIAMRLGITERHVRRLLKSTPAETPSSGNGGGLPQRQETRAVRL